MLWFVKYVAELPDSHPLHRGLGVAFAVTFFVSRIVFGLGPPPKATAVRLA